MALGGFDLVDQIRPNVIQHLDCAVGLSSVDVELSQESDNRTHPPDQTLMLARSVLVIWIMQLTNAVAKHMAWVL